MGGGSKPGKKMMDGFINVWVKYGPTQPLIQSPPVVNHCIP